MTRLFHDDASELSEDANRLLRDIERHLPGSAAPTADCRPPLDVVETATAVEVVVDVPGVVPAAVRVAMRNGTLLIVGTKHTARDESSARYHLAERSYGRFARIVRLDGAFDGRRARAVVNAGEIRVILPLIEDKRGALLTIPVSGA